MNDIKAIGTLLDGTPAGGVWAVLLLATAVVLARAVGPVLIAWMYRDRENVTVEFGGLKLHAGSKLAETQEEQPQMPQLVEPAAPPTPTPKKTRVKKKPDEAPPSSTPSPAPVDS